MDHENIVKLLNYTETSDEYVLYLEFCDKADYLANKVLEVIIWILTIFHRSTLLSITMIS